mgnify:CR=1 FL=1
MRTFQPTPRLPLGGLALLFLFFFSGCGLIESLERFQAKRTFKQAFRQAHWKEDPQALMDLYYLEGVRPEDRTLLRITARKEVVLPLQSVAFSEPAAGTTIHYTYKGRVFGPTLPVEKQMTVQYSNPDYLKVTYLLGYMNNQFYLVTARPVESVSVSDQ